MKKKDSVTPQRESFLVSYSPNVPVPCILFSTIETFYPLNLEHRKTHLRRFLKQILLDALHILKVLTQLPMHAKHIFGRKHLRREYRHLFRRRERILQTRTQIGRHLLPSVEILNGS